MTDPFSFADDLGPEKVIHIHNPALGLRAVVAIDNVCCGPAIGGVRIAVDATAEEAFRLARAMTLKNAAAGLPHGGGKSVIIGDPHAPAADKERVVRGFARAIRTLVDYIPGPDMGTDETCMAWVFDEIGRAVGLPPELGGIPLDELGATGFGLAVAVEEAQSFAGIALDGARVAVQGFGSVGRHAARFLTAKGARLVAASDSHATLHDPAGLDVDRLIAHKRAGNGLGAWGSGAIGSHDAILDVDCEIWIPAARPDVVTMDNVSRLKTRLIAQGANIPITGEAERALHERGVLSIPDFIANAGGVICAAAEYAGASRAEAFRSIEEKLRENTRAVLEEASRIDDTPRVAATAIATQRVHRAMTYRRR